MKKQRRSFVFFHFHSKLVCIKPKSHSDFFSNVALSSRSFALSLALSRRSVRLLWRSQTKPIKK